MARPLRLEEIDRHVLDGQALMLRLRIPPSDVSYTRERMLAGLLGITLDVSGGIAILMRAERVNNAEQQLRTLVETTIKMRYLYLTEDLTNAVALLLEATAQERRFANRMLAYARNHPEKEKAILRDLGDLPAEVADLDRRIHEFKTNYPSANPDLDLLSMAKRVDEKRDNSVYKALSVEEVYTYIYWLLSQRVHAGLRAGLEYLEVATKARDPSRVGRGDVKRRIIAAETTRLLCLSANRFAKEKFERAAVLASI